MAANEVQRITFAPVPTVGNFKLVFSGATTSNLAFSAISSALQTAFQGLAGIGANNAAVSGTAATGTLRIGYEGSLANTNVVQATAVNVSLLAQGTIASPIRTTIGNLTTAEVQSLAVPVATAGTFLLDSQTLNWNATVSAVQSAMNTALGVGIVTVSGMDGGPWVFTWLTVGAQSLLTVDGTNLTQPVVITSSTEQQGEPVTVSGVAIKTRQAISRIIANMMVR